MCSAGPDGNDMGRMSALDAGYDITSSGVTLDRFCGSGITTVNMAAASIMSGMEDMVIAGGCEMMSGYGRLAGEMNPFVDSGNTHLREMYGQSHQGLCADTIATIEGIPREALDRLAEVSQQRAAHAIENGYFDKSLVPVYHDDGSLALDKDEFPRPGTTMESLGQLQPSFDKLSNMPLDEEGTTYSQADGSEVPGGGCRACASCGQFLWCCGRRGRGFIGVTGLCHQAGLEAPRQSGCLRQYGRLSGTDAQRTCAISQTGTGKSWPY